MQFVTDAEGHIESLMVRWNRWLHRSHSGAAISQTVPLPEQTFPQKEPSRSIGNSGFVSRHQPTMMPRSFSFFEEEQTCARRSSRLSAA